jgi:hypothetical protein
MRLAIAFGISFLTALACSSPAAHPPGIGDTDSKGVVGGGGDTDGGEGGTIEAAAPNTVDGSACTIPGTFDLEIKSAMGGPYELAGTVTSSAPIAAGTEIDIDLAEYTSSGSIGGYGMYKASLMTTTSSFTFHVTGAQAPAYKVNMTSGTLDGWNGGTAGAPQHDQMAAPIIYVPPCHSDVNFGIGPK